MDLNILFDKLDKAQKVLIGIGTGFSKDCDNDTIIQEYNNLAKLFAEKDYFVVNISDETNIRQSDIDMNRVTMPLDSEASEEDNEKQWNEYTKWLQQTLNKDLLIIELGVGFDKPTLVRWPFEKIAQINHKAFLYRVNEKFPQLPEEIGEKGVSVKETVSGFLDAILTERFGK